MFGSIFRRRGERREAKSLLNSSFASPQIRGIRRGGEASYTITILIIMTYLYPHINFKIPKLSLLAFFYVANL
jgi:hypothetical protein